MFKNIRVAVGVLTIGLAAGACSAEAELSTAGTRPNTSATVSGEPMQGPPVDAAVVRGSSEYDFPQTKSVSEAAGNASSVLIGEVVGWTDGQTTVESDGAGYEDFSYNAVLAVKVEVPRLNAVQQEGEIAYVTVYRGGELRIDGQPQGSEPSFASLEELSAAVPLGTRVIVLANPAPPASQLKVDTPGAEIVSEAKGVPQGATLLQPTPQGLLFRDETGSFGSGVAEGESEWGWIPPSVPAPKSFDYLATEVAQLG